MKTFLISIVLGFLAIEATNAGVLNSPDSVKDVIDNLKPAAGAMYLVDDNKWATYTAFSLYTFEHNNRPIVDIHLGYITPDAIVAAATFDVSYLEEWGIYLPLGPIEPKIGLGIGYDYREKNATYGITTIGITWRF